MTACSSSTFASAVLTNARASSTCDWAAFRAASALFSSCCALVECLVGGPAFRDQRRGASQLLIREVQLGVVAGDTRLTGYKCLAGELSRRLRLVQLRHGLGRVDTGDHAPDWHDVAFVRNDLDNAPGYLRRNVDLGGLDPAVDADDACGQGRGLVLFPGDVTRSGAADQDHHRRHNDHIPIELHGFASESATAS